MSSFNYNHPPPAARPQHSRFNNPFYSEQSTPHRLGQPPPPPPSDLYSPAQFSRQANQATRASLPHLCHDGQHQPRSHHLHSVSGHSPNPGTGLESHIDPNLEKSFESISSTLRSSGEVVGQHSINRFFNEAESPWSAARAMGSFEYQPPPALPTGSTMMQVPNLNYPSYRPAPVSHGSNDTGPTHDSGYHSWPPERSQDPTQMNQDLPDLMKQIHHISLPTSADPHRSKSVIQDYSGIKKPTRRPRSQARSQAETCSTCGETSKCPSDAKKHRLKHEKPYKCDYPGCKREAGFITTNDLNRHKKSVHKVETGTTRSYRCVAPQCKNKDKIWPRLDNFKQHVNRMHQQEDPDDIIERSELPEASHATLPSPPIRPSPGLDPTLLLGVDDKFSNPAPNISNQLYLSPPRERESLPREFSQPLSFDGSNPGTKLPPLDSNYFKTPDYGRISGDSGFKVSPNRTETMSTDSSAGLSALATAAEVKGKLGETQAYGATSRNPDSSSTAVPPKTSVASKDSNSLTDPPSLDLGSLAKLIAAQLQSSNSATDDQPLEQKLAQALATTPGFSELVLGKGKRSSASRSNVSTPSKSKQCPDCASGFSRACDLKKHQRRHERPYGCTYPKCHKTFGAKSDWKRHENSQHFQLETFRCPILLPRSSKQSNDKSPHPSHSCGKLFYRNEHFREHLVHEHALGNTVADSTITENRIGRNGQSRFWCGFCGKICSLMERRAAAWDERFNHIDIHFTKQGRRQEEWWCMEARKRKGEVKREMDNRNFDDGGDELGEGEEGVDADGDIDADGEGDEENTPQPEDRGSGLVGQGRERYGHSNALPMAGSAAVSSPQPPSGFRSLLHFDGIADLPSPLSPPVPGQQQQQHRSKKRRLDGEDENDREEGREVHAYCCECGDGPWRSRTYSQCMGCQHELCGKCSRKMERIGEEI